MGPRIRKPALGQVEVGEVEMGSGVQRVQLQRVPVGLLGVLTQPLRQLQLVAVLGGGGMLLVRKRQVECRADILAIQSGEG